MRSVFALEYFLMQVLSINSIKLTRSQTLGILGQSEPLDFLQTEAGLSLRCKGKYWRIFCVRESDFINTDTCTTSYTHTGRLVSIKSRNRTLKAGLWKEDQFFCLCSLSASSLAGPDPSINVFFNFTPEEDDLALLTFQKRLQHSSISTLDEQLLEDE